MNRSWPTRPPEGRDMIVAAKAWLPLQGLAVISAAPLVLFADTLGELAPIGWLAVGSVAAAIGAVWRFPAALAADAAALPRLGLDGRELSLPTLAGRTLHLRADERLKLRCGWYRIHGGVTIGGTARGLWLELVRDDQRALIVGDGDFGGMDEHEFTELTPPHAPYDQKVRTEPAAVVELRRLLSQP
jgi:hypothetical protein